MNDDEIAATSNHVDGHDAQAQQPGTSSRLLTHALNRKRLFLKLKKIFQYFLFTIYSKILAGDPITETLIFSQNTVAMIDRAVPGNASLDEKVRKIVNTVILINCLNLKIN